MKRSYYGWWIVGGAILCQFMSMSVSQAVVGVFMRPVVDDLGWSIWQYTLGSSMTIIAGAVSGVVAGKIVDSRGPRPLILIGALASSFCLALLGLQSNIVVFLVLYTIGGLVGWNLFGGLVLNATLSKWFIRNRGWALAIGSIGISLGGLITPLAMTTVVDSYGWRAGYFVLAGCVAVLVIPTAFVMRRTPEDHGLAPDGDAFTVPGRAATVITEERSLTRSEALRTSGFWLLTAGYFLILAALMSVLVHAIPFATDAGFSRTMAASALAVNGFGNLVSKAVWAYGLRQIQPRKLVVIAYSVSSLGVAMMLISTTNVHATILLAGFFLYGFGFGGTIPLSETLWAKYFGRAHIGAIRGVGYPVTIIGTACGPILIGYWLDVSQSYQPAFVAIIGAYMSGSLLVWLSRAPQRAANS